MMNKKWLSFLLLFSITCTSIFGCSEKKEEEVSSTTKTSANYDCPYDEFIVVDVLDSLANFQGIQSGWFAEIVKQKFNMELNIIAPNVTGGGDTLYDMRYAAGNLGDLVITTSENGKLQDMVSAGLLINMEEMLEDKSIMRYESAIKSLNDKIQEDGIYAIPSEISTQPATNPSEGLDLNFGPYLRWDLYKELGYPKLKTLEDLLPVLKAMQDINPVSDSGDKTYALSLFKDWDGNLMNNAKQPACLYGYDEFGFLLVKADGSDYQSIIDTDSMYMRVLKFFFDANQMGLVDPESTTQNYTRLFEKYEDGAILYSFWPWLGQSAYNTIENENEGKGFMLADIEDMKIFSYGCTQNGNQKCVIAVGSQAKDPERLADFIDWLYSPEGVYINNAQPSGGAPGPEGVTWEMTDEGPVLTELGIKALLNGDADMPAELGGGTFRDGVSTLNYYSVSKNEIAPNGYPYYYTLWDSVQNMSQSTLEIDWSDKMDALNTLEYLEKNNKIIVAPGTSFISPIESTEITTLRNQCKRIIVDYSWKMIFAESEDSFYALQKELQTTVLALGYEQVLEKDMENALKQNEERLAAITASESVN